MQELQNGILYIAEVNKQFFVSERERRSARTIWVVSYVSEYEIL